MIEDQLYEAIAATGRRSSASQHHAIMLDFYGFRGGDPFRTLAACGEPRGLTRERIRQILAKTLPKIGPIAVPDLRRALSIFEERRFWSGTALRTRLIDAGVIGEDAVAEAVIFLLADLGLDSRHSVYDQWLRPISRTHWQTTADTMILPESLAESVRKHIKPVRTAPGQTGIVGLEEVLSHREGIDDDHVAVLRHILSLDPATWVTEYGGRTCYIVEDLDTQLFSFSEKIFRNDGWLNISTLTEICRNTLRGRMETYRYPDRGLLETYFRSSQWFECDGDRVRYLGIDRSRAARSGNLLRDIDRDIIAYLHDRPYGDFSAMRDHLVELGHGQDTVTAVISSSALVYVDRSRGRGYHRYTLVDHLIEGAISRDGEDELSAYERCRRRLEALEGEATDGDTESTHRREQHILQDYLFEGRDHQHCALCGHQYGVHALIAAHKKRREHCAPAERLDPDIVMPLCLFGCDYLYEHSHVAVIDGHVRSHSADAHGAGEREAMARLDGRPVEERWLAGKAGYFERR